MTGGPEAVARARALISAAQDGLSSLPASLFACATSDLGALLAELAQLGRLAAAAQVAILQEALSRGHVAASDAACPADWVMAHSGPSTPVTEALMLSRVAATCLQPRYAVLDAAVRDGRVAPSMAEVIVREFGKTMLALEDSLHDEALAGFVELAVGGAPPRVLAQLRERLVSQHGPADALQRHHDRLACRRGMSGFGRDLDGMYHAVLVLDPAAHAVIHPVIDALSAPASTTDDGTPRRDGRSPNAAWMPWWRSAPPTPAWSLVPGWRRRPASSSRWRGTT